MSAFQQALFELERAHQQAKSLYEEEVVRLRRELESRGIPIPPPSDPKTTRHSLSFPEGRAPPSLPANQNPKGTGGLFGAIMGNTATMGQGPTLPPQSGHPGLPAQAANGMVSRRSFLGHYPPGPDPKRPRISSEPIGPSKKSTKTDEQPSFVSAYKNSYKKKNPALTQIPRGAPRLAVLPSTKPTASPIPAPLPLPSSHKTPAAKHHSHSAEAGWKKGGDDWSVLMNPSSPFIQKAQPSLDLMHSLDHERFVFCQLILECRLLRKVFPRRFFSCYGL